MSGPEPREVDPGVGGKGRRIERRSVRHAARRRRRRRSLLIAAAPLLVVIAVAVTLLIVFGGRSSGSEGPASQTTVPPSATTETAGGTGTSSILIAIEEDGAVPAMVLLSRTGQGGVALGMPGNTLVRTDEGFVGAGDLFLEDKRDPLRSGLDRDLGIDLGGVAGVSWSELLDALGKAGSTETWPPTIGNDVAGAIEAAGAVLALVRVAPESAGAEALQNLEIDHDAAAVRSFVAEAGSGITDGTWGTAAIPGRPREGADGDYWEPDTAAAKEFLSKGVPAGGTITLEVQNGSGVLDAAQAAGTILEPLGYDMLPYQNADSFPDLEKTTITAAPDSLAEAVKIKQSLGVGVVGQDESLASRHIRVIVGKDFAPAGGA